MHTLKDAEYKQFTSQNLLLYTNNSHLKICCCIQTIHISKSVAVYKQFTSQNLLLYTNNSHLKTCCCIQTIHISKSVAVYKQFTSQNLLLVHTFKNALCMHRVNLMYVTSIWEYFNETSTQDAVSKSQSTHG